MIKSYSESKISVNIITFSMFILYGSLISSNIKNSLEHYKSVHPYHAEFIQCYVNVSHYYSSTAYEYERENQIWLLQSVTQDEHFKW